MTGKRLPRRILAVGLVAAAFGVAEAQQVQEVDSTEIPPVANQAAVDATPCGFGRDLNENQTLVNLELFSVHWCNAISGTWEGVASGLPSFTEGQVARGDSAGSIKGSAAHFFDESNDFLGVGTDTPEAGVHVQNDGTPTFRLEALSATRKWDISIPGGLENFAIGEVGEPIVMDIGTTGRTTFNGQLNDSFLQAVNPLGVLRLTKTGGARFAELGFQFVANEFSLAINGTPVLHVDLASFFKIGGGTNPTSRLDIGDGSLTMEEISTPGSPLADTLRCYAGDVAGKTALCCVFPTGAQQCSTELVEP